MRIGIIGASHWHAGMYINALRDIGADIVAVADDNKEVAEKVSGEIGCKAYTDYEQLLSERELDFVFAFGRHCQMPAIARALIDKGINFAIEKPVGIDYREVEQLAELAKEKDIFVAVPFVFRLSPLAKKLLRLKAEGRLGDFVHLYFRYIAGPPDRYVRWGCDWMLDKAQSGGGCTINLGVHFIDLFYYLTHEELTSVLARMSNKVHKKGIEDTSVIVMESTRGTICVVETGYSYPADDAETYYTIRTTEHYFIFQGNTLRWLPQGGEERQVDLSGQYGEFVKHTLSCVKQGRKPIADLGDAARALRIVNQAYEDAGAH